MESKIKIATVGSTVYIYDDSTRTSIEKAAFSKGEAVVEPDGSKVYQQDEAVLDFEKAGSEIYTWDKAGNKIKHIRYRVHVDKDGSVKKTKIRTVWKSPV